MNKLSPAPVAYEALRAGFPDPPFAFHTRPLWFWNGPLTPEETRAMMQRGRDEDGYAGFSILPAPGMTPAFMTPQFLEQYRIALDIAAELGLKMCLYDEFWFPSGSAGGLLPAQYPQALSRRLDLAETLFHGPGTAVLPLPPGDLMGAVAMEQASLERLDVSEFVQGSTLEWDAPSGDWRVMIFTCVIDEKRELVDYLDPARVALFVDLTYGAYFRAFPEHFGTTIDSAFYDEPTLYRVEGARNWTEQFNDKFCAAHGYSPVLLYPVLWHDIGPETAAARNALFGFRAELFSRGFVRTLNDWSEAHGLCLTGHVDQEEVVNPVGVSGDLIKIFEHQDIPGVDQISWFGRGSKTYKVVSSAAYNYDKPLVMAECYGAVTGMPALDLYREAMDLFVKGVNWMVPHAVWYDPATLVFEPELSYRHPVYGPKLPAYNRFMARLHWLLQRGRHVADVAVLYPIAALQGGYFFSDLDVYTGGATPLEADYLEIGEMLATEVRCDFTFLHPEVLAGRCKVQGGRLHLENTHNSEEYQVVVLPGSETVSAGSIARLRQFWEQGGTVIGTTRLPDRAAEFGGDAAVQADVRALFGPSPGPVAHVGTGGGRAYFLAAPEAASLSAALDDASLVRDVRVDAPTGLPGGHFGCLHKVIEGAAGDKEAAGSPTIDIYFLANASDVPVEALLHLRGSKQLEQWDPESGRQSVLSASIAALKGEAVTVCPITLDPVSSTFLVGHRF